jgi:hypothetical protein
MSDSKVSDKGIVGRFTTALNALIREKKLYSEDLETMVEVKRILAERKQAAKDVTDEMVERAVAGFNGRGTAFMTLDRSDMRAMRAALEAIAPMLARVGVPEGWKPISTAPIDGTPHIRGLHVFSVADGRCLYWDAVCGKIDTEDGSFNALDGDIVGWDAADFTHWHPLSAAPSPKEGKNG